MVGSVNSSSIITPQQMSGSNNSSSLTSSQLETISSVLSNYDSSNLSSEDASAIVEAFSTAGISPSRELANVMSSEGFNAKEVGDLAGVGRGDMPPPPPPPPSGNEQEESDISSLLDTLLSIDSEDEESSTTASFNEIMEYTSRIINLNEASKTEVMDLLDKYSSQETDYSSSEVNNIIRNSLGQILSDSDNYNRVSFYA